MVCPNCNAELRDGAMFCMACGHFLGRERDPFATPTIPYTQRFPTGLQETRLHCSSNLFRLMAYFLDSLVIGIPLGIFGVGYATYVNPDPDMAETWIPQFIWALTLVSVLANAVYFSAFEASTWRATPGKKLFAMVVTDMEGEALALPHAVLRNVLKLLLSPFILASLLSALFSSKNQTLYDWLSGTRVIEDEVKTLDEMASASGGPIVSVRFLNR